MTTGQPPTEPATGTMLLPGQIVAGSYRIERLLGKGGMATVWEAITERTGKRVALKTLAEGTADPAAAAMLRREALAAGRVSHPNVVTIYDVVEHAGATCVVMEILEGEPLSAYLARKGYLSLDDAAALLLPAMRGVAAANAMGVIHRDLKPKNIFICTGPDGRVLTTKVVDFGIAVVRDYVSAPALPSEAVPTHGSPAYMSPEHIQGWSDIDARADVYGFGVLFFELLTGQLPFLGEPGSELLMRIVEETAPRLSLFRPDVDEAVVLMVERALAKDPNDRFPSLEVFIAEVETQVGSSLPRVLAGPAGTGGPAAASPVPARRSSAARPAVGAPASGDPTDTRKVLTTSRPQKVRRAAAPPAAPAPRATADVAAARADSRAGSRRRPLVTFALFAGVLLLVAWLAFPRLPDLDDFSPPARRVSGVADAQLPMARAPAVDGGTD